MDVIESLKNLESNYEFEDTLYFKFLISKSHFKDIDRMVSIYQPFFTLHNRQHSDSILSILNSFELNSLIEDNPLNKHELFCLCTASYLHDIGMIETSKDESKKYSDNHKLGSAIRKNHHERSYNHIIKYKDRLHLNDFFAKRIALIAKGHRKVDIQNDINYKPTSIPNLPANRIRMDLITSLLRIADELDISFERAKERERQYIEKLTGYDIITSMHWLKHYYTIGFSTKIIKETGGGFTKLSIDISFRIPNNGLKNTFIIPFIIKPIQNELKILNPIFSNYGFQVEIDEVRDEIDTNLINIQKKLLNSFQDKALLKLDINALIIDDDSITRRDFTKILSKMGFFVECAENCLEGLNKFENGDYHLVLLDLEMLDCEKEFNKKAGLQFLERVGDKSNNSIIIVLTNLPSDNGLIVKCMSEGAIDFFSKTDDTNNIKNKIIRTIKKNLYKII